MMMVPDCSVESSLGRRKYVYVLEPSRYELAPCSCGNVDTEWSQFVGRLWCAKCKRDFIPEHGGVFDDPIPVKAAHLLGFCFSRINIQTGAIERDQCCDVGE